MLWFPIVETLQSPLFCVIFIIYVTFLEVETLLVSMPLSDICFFCFSSSCNLSLHTLCDLCNCLVDLIDHHLVQLVIKALSLFSYHPFLRVCCNSLFRILSINVYTANCIQKSSGTSGYTSLVIRIDFKLLKILQTVFMYLLTVLHRFW